MEVILAVLVAVILLGLLAVEGRASQLADRNEQLQEQLSYLITKMQQDDQDQGGGYAPFIVLGLLVLVAVALLFAIR